MHILLLSSLSLHSNYIVYIQDILAIKEFDKGMGYHQPFKYTSLVISTTSLMLGNYAFDIRNNMRDIFVVKKSCVLTNI